MARTRLLFFALFTAASVILFARHFSPLAYAQQPVSSQNPRLAVMPLGAIDGAKGGTRAAFIKDTKTGQCWLWVNESGEGSALAPARESACN